MPHINRIRVNNIKYNLVTQYYDDFLMLFSFKNKIYYWANGGGKSVLMLLLLQNMIPNCTLDDKQPVEKLFRTGEGSTTIHSLIEWDLSDAHIRNNYRYMLTGFCARKARDLAADEPEPENGTEEDQGNSAAIQYFNYCIFYRKYNENDIKNLPLEKNGEKITYSGLKNYLKELEKKDLSLEVRIFERKGDYQRFIAGYGIYESEWEIIRGINKTEGHVRTYFETNYKTTRKVVEDLLIEEIIEKSFRNKYAGEENRDALAETLLNIKDKLLELSKKKEEIHNYDRQISIVEGFMERLGSFKQLYSGMDSAVLKLRKLYNTLTAEEQRNKQEKETSADKRLTLLKDKNELAMKVETAKVLADMEELESLSRELEGMEAELKEYEEKLNNIQEQLKISECGNYYLEYMEYRREYETLKQVIANMQEDSAAVISEIRKLTAVKKQQDALRRKLLSQEEEKEQQALADDQDRLDRLNGELKKTEQEIAVWEYQIQTCRGSRERLDEKLQEAMGRTELLMAAGAPAALTETDTEIDKISLRLKELEAEEDILKEERMEKRIRLEKLRFKMETARSDFSRYQSEQGTGLSNEDKLDKLKEVYGEAEIGRLMQKILELYRKTITDCQQQRQSLDLKQRQIEALKQRKPICENREVLNILQYITRYHGNAAISGADYLAGLSCERIMEVLEVVPFLPFSVVITRDFEEIVYDGKLTELLSDNGAAVLIDGNAIDKITDSRAYSSEVVYLLKNKDYYDDEKKVLYLKRLERELQELEAAYNRKRENEQIILEDYGFLTGISGHGTADSRTKPEEIRNALTELETEEAAVLNALKDGDNVIAAILREKQQLVSELDMLREKKETLGLVINLLEEYQSRTEALEQAEQERQQLAGICQSSGKHLEALQNQVENRKKRLAVMQREQKEMEERWNRDYAKYDEESEEKPEIAAKNSGYDGLSAGEVDIKLAALVESLNQEYSSAADKEKLLRNYGDSMKKCISRIEYLGGNLSEFKQQQERNLLIQTDASQLSKYKENQKELMERQAKKKHFADEKRSVRDKLQGKITHAVSMISKKYGYFDADMVSRQEVRVFLNQNDALLSVIESQMEQESEKLKKLEQKDIMLQMLKRDAERLLNRSGLKPSASFGMLESGADLQQECQNISEQLDIFIEERFKRSKEFEKDLNLLVDTLNSLNSHALAMEIRNNITMPSNAEETEQLIQTFSETCRYIGLEKQRVLQGLDDIQAIKENFENQCIQSCINIRTELERLDKLSVITMGDEKIRMIQLKIPYVKEEQYQERMSDYIDHIAEATDGFEETGEKLRYLRNNLCWKKLFSVIVTDMNGIRLNLYKRERLADRSRYLPYEEAVGSTGQSQGIYIQFLISIINYISSINSGSSDAARLKKVIFIDNPFGAAKDIYIWEPIFKLLKTNNVQLIVPARGATPAITGRFDVNYILGQKMCNGRQQTVVVDFYSSVSGEELEYTAVDYEQNSLFS